MRLATPLRILLPFACLAAVSTAAVPAYPPLPFGLRPIGADSLILGDSIPLPPWRDFAVGPAGDLLLLGDDGQLLVLAADSSRFAPFDGDLDGAVWPDAIAADGHDWLLLAAQGRELFHLGRRGEDLGSLRIRVEGGPWRDLAVDRSGRIWLAEPNGGQMLLLSRGGQELQRWFLEERLPGYRGPLTAWCPDGSGGLYLLAGNPVRLHRLNGAGNPVALPQPPQLAGAGALAIDARGELRLLARWEGRPPGLAYARSRGGPLLLGRGALWRTRLAEPSP